MENRLGVQLPPFDKAMIRLDGTSIFNVLGVDGSTKPTGLDGKGFPNVVFTTEEARHRVIIGNGMILFKTSGFGPAFLLNCTEADEFGEAPVYEFPVGGVANGRDKPASGASSETRCNGCVEAEWMLSEALKTSMNAVDGATAERLLSFGASKPASHLTRTFQ